MTNKGKLKIGIKISCRIKNIYSIFKNSIEKVFLHLRKG